MKYLFLLSAIIISLSCGKATETGCTPNPVANEKAAMIAFANSNNITYTEHSSGILYEIMNAGTGATLTLASTVSAVYTGKLMSGTTFDARATPISFPLSGVIEGWKIGIPLIKAGGRIKLIIPSALAYSCVGRNSIPPNSPLYFDVTVQ
ncbi:MAG: hypothetical protein EAZ13_00775 [Sphingobacteriia bacterium]|nr:MAG: hypothetical protein EAZ13_00775 [Sphingobacteriia bacterium]